jgi:hypothetical protein
MNNIIVIQKSYSNLEYVDFLSSKFQRLEIVGGQKSNNLIFIFSSASLYCLLCLHNYLHTEYYFNNPCVFDRD